jgi:glycerate dehydrogenase
MAFALILEIANHVGEHSKSVQNGQWSKSKDWCYWNYPLIELADKTIGIIGLGRIGEKVAKIAKGFNMKVIAYNHNIKKSRHKYGKYVDLEKLLEESDIITLHCPLVSETEGIINRHTISKMKDGVIIINNSRGQLIVEKDLADALNSGKVYAAGVDVASSEPIDENNPLIKAKNCIITPHISWAPKESRKRLMDLSIENLESFFEGNPLNIVNQ